MSFFVGGAWIDAPKGSLVIAPGGTAHDFENRTAARAGALNLSVPGDFEPHMGGSPSGSARAPPPRPARRTRHAANRSVQAADPLEGEGAVEHSSVTSTSTRSHSRREHDARRRHCDVGQHGDRAGRLAWVVGASHTARTPRAFPFGTYA
jgi:hypothetical protein